MTLFDPPLNKDDFLAISWDEVVNESESNDCYSYSWVLRKHAVVAGNSGDQRAQVVLSILATITSATIRLEKSEDFFRDFFSQSLFDEHRAFLSEIVDIVSDAELRSRIADILWCIDRKYQMAQIAIPTYLETAKNLEDPEHWVLCFSRIKRAFDLAHTLRQQVETVVSYVEQVLDRYQGSDPLWLSVSLIELLQSKRLGDPHKYAMLSSKAASIAESNSNWRKARELWTLKARWHHLDSNICEEFSALMLAAETYEKEAEECLGRINFPSYTYASNLLERAVMAFREINQGEETQILEARRRAQEAHKRLLQYQRKSNDEMIPLSHKVDITDLVKNSRDCVRGKEFREAIFNLVLIADCTDIDNLREQVKRLAQDFVWSDLFPSLILNEQGKHVARQPGSVLSDNPEEAEEATLFEMYQQAGFYQKMIAEARIEPARHQIFLEHNIQYRDIAAILLHSPFIPPDRRYTFIRGIYAGITGDFLSAMHMLIPQLENSFRYIMGQREIITSGLDQHGMQKEHDLNILLKHEKIGEILDKNTLFDLRTLLIEKAGHNFRNRLAHGLIRDDEFMSPMFSYVWWLILRLCCLPIIIHEQKSLESEK